MNSENNVPGGDKDENDTTPDEAADNGEAAADEASNDDNQGTEAPAAA